MEIKSISLHDLRKMNDSEGLVLQGCGGDLQEWVDGINDMLTESGILQNDNRFEKAYSFKNGGLTCLLFPFEDVQLDVGKLAIWRLRTRHCRIGADGGNHSEKSIACSVSGFGRVLAFDYNQLLYSWCGYPGDSERLRPADRCCVRVFYGHRFRSGTGAFCRIARTDEPREST